MPLILHIDTATEYAGVGLSQAGELIAKEEDINQKNHASFLHFAIQNVLAKASRSLNEIDAVAVTGGPGSYTGIRVGLSSAKGICYALNKPLILINTLQVIAAAALAEAIKHRIFTDTDFCIFPMIDARRMEVFGGSYSPALYAIDESAAFILDDAFFSTLKKDENILFCGNGSGKINNLQLGRTHAIIQTQHTVNHMVEISEKAFLQQNFADIAYVEPIYVKEFYNAQQKPSLG
jgi:tRNA threonylcarbamoyladenosine biosynthesis protein TsaB